MKTFIVLQKIVSFRVNWHTLFNPQAYQLILMVHEPTLAKLAADQKKCFSQIHALDKFDKPSLSTAIQNIINSNNNNVTIITNDELCIELAAQLREQFNLTGDRQSIVSKFLNKTENKQIMSSQQINIPKYDIYNPEHFKSNTDIYVNQILKKLGLPIFAKPIDSAASQGVNKINTVDELNKWCWQHINNKNYELDEFITGKLLQCDSIIQNNEILFAQVNENAHPCFDFMSGKITGGITLPPHDPLVAEILAYNERVLTALKPLPNCVTHLEIFQRPNGELVFLEIACRAPGGMIVQMHEKHTGINVEQAHFAMQMNLEFDLSKYKKGPYCAWAWFPLIDGKVKGFRELDIKSLHEIFWKIKLGDTYQKAQSLIDFGGGIILWNDDYKILRADFDYLANLTQPVIMTENDDQIRADIELV